MGTTNKEQNDRSITLQLILDMQDKDEEIRELRGKIDEMEQELARRQKQIQSLKKTNRIQEQHIELQRRKFIDSENKKAPSQVLPDDDITREAGLEIKRLKDKLDLADKEKDKYEKNIRQIQRQIYSLKQQYDELSAKDQAHSKRIKDLEEQNKKLSSQMKQSQSSNRNEKKLREEMAKQSSQISKLTNQLKKKDEELKKITFSARKSDDQIKKREEEIIRLRQELRRSQAQRSELKKNIKIQEEIVTDESKSNLFEEHNHLFNTYNFSKKEEENQKFSQEQSQKWMDQPFFNSTIVPPKATFTAVPLSMSMNEQNFRVAQTHQQFFSLIERYQSGVYPQEKISFLNMTIYVLQDYLQKIYNGLDRAYS